MTRIGGLGWSRFLLLLTLLFSSSPCMSTIAPRTLSHVLQGFWVVSPFSLSRRIPSWVLLHWRESFTFDFNWIWFSLLGRKCQNCNWLLTCYCGYAICACLLLRLQKMGALDVNRVVHRHQGWRLISCMWLHAGVVHLLSNMLGILFIGIRLEQEFGFGMCHMFKIKTSTFSMYLAIIRFSRSLA